MINDGWTKERALNINVIYNDGTGDIYLDSTVKSVRWSGDVKQAARKISVEFLNTLDGRKQALEIQKGKELRFISEGVELFRGVIFSDSISFRGEMSITAYDENIYLTKSDDTKKFVEKTASAIIRALGEEYGIPIGEIADTGYVIPKLILRDKSLYDMIVIALTETYNQTGRRYFLTSRQGKLTLFERKDQVVRWVLENGTNIIDANYSANIEEMKTKVKIQGEDKNKNPLIAVVQDDELIKQFGIMQHLESADSDMSTSQMKQRAEQLLKELGQISDEAGLSCLGIDDVYAGGAVYVYEEMTRIVGGYYISSDVHTWESGSHTMEIVLSATDDLPTMEYDPPDEAKAKTTRQPATKKPKQAKPSLVDLIFNAKGVG